MSAYVSLLEGLRNTRRMRVCHHYNKNLHPNASGVPTNGIMSKLCRNGPTTHRVTQRRRLPAGLKCRQRTIGRLPTHRLPSRTNLQGGGGGWAGEGGSTTHTTHLIITNVTPGNHNQSRHTGYAFWGSTTGLHNNKHLVVTTPGSGVGVAACAGESGSVVTGTIQHQQPPTGWVTFHHRGWGNV